MRTMKMTRRALLGVAAAGATATLAKPASAAEFEFNLGVNTPEVQRRLDAASSR